LPTTSKTWKVPAGLTGNAGDNKLSGGAGYDILRGEDGADRLDGGNDIDLVTYWGSAVAVTVDLEVGAGGGGAAGDVFISIESVNGSMAGDTLSGGTGTNTLNGYEGDDVLSGGFGADVLIGDTGADTLAGGDDTDTLTGGAGADTLTGGNHKDTLTGGTGTDRFVYTAISDSLVGTYADRITDFSHAQGDKIDLSAIDANAGTAGDQAFTFIGTALYSGVAGQLRYYSDGTVTTIGGDTNGDGKSDFHIQLTGAIALVAGDFVL
jgi:serralysin